MVSFSCQEGARYWLQDTGCRFDMVLDTQKEVLLWEDIPMLGSDLSCISSSEVMCDGRRVMTLICCFCVLDICHVWVGVVLLENTEISQLTEVCRVYRVEANVSSSRSKYRRQHLSGELHE